MVAEVQVVPILAVDSVFEPRRKVPLLVSLLFAINVTNPEPVERVGFILKCACRGDHNTCHSCIGKLDIGKGYFS